MKKNVNLILLCFHCINCFPDCEYQSSYVFYDVISYFVVKSQLLCRSS